MTRSAIAHLLLLAALTVSLFAQAEPPEIGADSDTASDSDDAVMRARQAIDAAASEPDRLRALANLVNLQRRRGDYADGIAGARDGLARARQIADARLQIEFLYQLGRLHWNLTDYPRSVEVHLEELKVANALSDPALLARTHGALGRTYDRFNRDADAVQQFDLAMKFARQSGDERQLANIYSSLGNYHLNRKDHAKAGEYHRECLRLREKYSRNRALADALTNVGLVANATGDPATALDYLNRSLAIYERLKFRRYIANTHRRIATVLRGLGRGAEGLSHLGLALESAETVDSQEVFAEIFEEYARTHESLGNFQQAIGFERRMAVARESMRGEQDSQRMAELSARYGAEQRELEIALLKRDQELKNAELDRRRSHNLALLATLGLGVVVLVASVAVFYFRLRAERRERAATEHARQRAEAAERLKSRLLQIASHDLKVPLTALNATAALIGRSPADEAGVRRLSAGIQADTARMRGLVRDFLDAAAIEDGNLQLNRTEVDLPRLAGDAIESLRPVALQKEQKLEVEMPATALPTVQADPERLRQVFDNLISNALKFSPRGGRVRVTLGGAGSWAYAEVHDEGPGLGPADFARIFSPFQPLSAKPTGSGEDSTGLGLFIARELLALQGGRLEVQSQPGQGSVFRVLLPVAAAAPTV